MRASVVLAAHDAARSIGRCLEALARQEGIEEAEVIVASSSTDETETIIRERFPAVRCLQFDEGLTVSELRGRAIAIAKGEIIAVIDPYSIVQEGWLRELLRIHAERPELVVGGTVDFADADSRSLLEWAVYINEYGLFMPPLASGRVALLPGCNISYKRQALFDGDRPRYASFWKTVANQDAASSGSGLWLNSEAVVALDKPVPFGDFLATRYHHGRCFAAMRGGALAERLGRALSAPLLPLVFLWRWGRPYLRRSRHPEKLLLTLPLQVLLFGNWSRGELVGYLFGIGRSGQKLFY